MNNNDQQFHDNSFEEEQQPKTVVESSYEYVFSSGIHVSKYRSAICIVFRFRIRSLCFSGEISR